MYVIIYKEREEVKVMSRYAIMSQEEMMIEEEIANNLLDKMIRRYGFEHSNTISFAWYVENMDFNNISKAFDELY